MSIVVTVCGGLGNQLFQLFTAYALGLQTNRPVYVKNTCSNREFANKIIFTVDTRIPQESYTAYNEAKEFELCDLPQLGSVSLHGYFQCSEYFDSVFPLVKDRLKIQFPPERYPGTVLHIRKTDYVTFQNIYVQLDKTYYENASIFPGPYSIVTDDKNHPFVKDLANRFHATVYSRDTYTDFWFLFGHAYIVCANSTFSWWASYFAQKDHDAVVLRPDVYLKNGQTIK
jgi:hypothetical protein